MNAYDIIEAIRAAGASSNKEILDTLEDGAALASLGINDGDIEAAEEAHAIVSAA